MPSEPASPTAPAREATGWQAIRDSVLARIRAGEWAPGAQIPNEADLARDFGCARATVNRALRELAATGLIDRRRKAGTRVALQPLRRVTLEIPVIRTEVEARGGQYGYALIARAQGPAPLAVWSRMGLGAGDGLLHLRALHLSDGAPYMYEDR
jgi:GntR family histidine utilization transcriptional repressor